MSIMDDKITAKLRLKQMKLAGFKSFVDPTTLYFPSHLVGIVGPNGCGKSNIIDAVRWVMGESSAKSLRAETGIDVIFNGSNDRKPVGQASVELIFDNPPGAISGEYAQFRELSIKRVLDRDGQSTYYLNHVRCRRRDITDLFLGTGLGSRSYAVIEQGMISRLIEAKPDELRVYLEEAAGISRYHERRRETETSIKHTRENITRLSDLSQELAQQLEKLAEQSKKAKIYRDIQQRHKQVQHDLLTKQWYVAEVKRLQSTQAKQTLTTNIELQEASLVTLEDKSAELRELAADRYQSVNDLQAQFYQLGTDVGRIEEQLTSLQTALANTEKALTEQQLQHETQETVFIQDEERKQILTSQLQQQRQDLARLEVEHQVLVDTLLITETDYEATQAAWQQLTQAIYQAKTAHQVLETQQQQEEKQLQQLTRRLAQLKHEQTELKPVDLEAIRELQQAHETEQQALHALEQARHTTAESLLALSKSIQEKSTTQMALQRQLMQHEAKLTSLTSLQQKALGQQNQQQQSWLTMRGLADKRLGQLLTVEPTWAKAVEALLGDWLQAVVVDAPLPSLLTQGMPPHGSLFVCPQTRTLDWPESLASVVDKPALLPKAFDDVYVAMHLSAALDMLAQLDIGASILLPDGLWISHDWIRVPASSHEDDGVLVREEQIAELNKLLKTQQAEFDVNQSTLVAWQEQHKALQVKQNELQQSHQSAVSRTAKLEAALTIQQAAHTQAKMQQEQLLTAISASEEALHIQTEKLDHMHMQVEQAQDNLTQLQQRQHSETHAHETLQQLKQTQTKQERELQQQIHALTVQHERAQAELAALSERQQTKQQQKAEREQLLVALQQQLVNDGATQATIAGYLQAALHKRLEAEAEVTAAKALHQQAESAMTELNALRQQAQRTLDSLRNDMAKLSAEEEAELVRQQHWQAQATSVQYTDEPQQLPEPQLSVLQLTKQVQSLQSDMLALEPVNLAAIDEYQETDERYQYLQAQQQDLLDALATLEQAIQKMDKETRMRLQETFEKVNAAFQAIFPKVFGGGSAYLSLTEEELLTAGITVMARPPGKRNSSIHLLSGGEKALTAIALIFSIFQLNPAPFCLLDEVDAPLDEANVHRYCELIKTMSQDVQFIFISHNRVTMELADQLLGVTMKEPGVSRLVAVDLAETMDFIAADRIKAGA